MRTFIKTDFLFYMLRWPSRLGRQTHRVYVVSSERHHLGYLEIAGSIPARSIRFNLFFANPIPAGGSRMPEVKSYPADFLPVLRFGCTGSVYLESCNAPR